LGSFAFQFFLSEAEEFPYRALPIGVLCAALHKKKEDTGYLEMLIAETVFTVAHINRTISPFVLYFSRKQLLRSC
jgi:hypothetical protein